MLKSRPIMSYILSWSGGKDSCFAGYVAMRQGYKISCLVNFISKEYKRVSFHGTEDKLIQLQSDAIGIPLFQKETTPEGYEQEFRQAVEKLKCDGVKGMIFGDIYLEEHKDWVERVCCSLGIEAVEPLWGRDPDQILSDFIEAGFEAVIVSAQSKLIDRDWIGHRVDTDFIKYLKDNSIDVCGENGEYHTLVTDGPIFNKKIEIIGSRTIARDNYWFLDTIKYQLA